MEFPSGTAVGFNDPESLVQGFHAADRVEGLTHRFYKYPGRFSPEFVRRVIVELTAPGDVVLDPFMGGGTTIVEALALGRRAVGIDINDLARFVTQVKTTPLSAKDAKQIAEWARLVEDDDVGVSTDIDTDLDPRVRNLTFEARRFFSGILAQIDQARFPRQRRFLRCALLRVGQWALDNSKRVPSRWEMLQRLQEEVGNMLEELRDFTDAARSVGIPKNKVTGQRLLLHATVTDDGISSLISGHGEKPSLVLTSPPYPAVHVLYHRWQVSGRRESPAPYWLADLRDGKGASFYTMGSRSPLGLRNYFATLKAGFENIRAVLCPEAIVVQIVGFSDARTQLPLFQNALSGAGYVEVRMPSLVSTKQTRTVPHRKWYTYNQIASDASQEVLLVHRLSA